MYQKEHTVIDSVTPPARSVEQQKYHSRRHSQYTAFWLSFSLLCSEDYALQFADGTFNQWNAIFTTQRRVYLRWCVLHTDKRMVVLRRWCKLQVRVPTGREQVKKQVKRFLHLKLF